MFRTARWVTGPLAGMTSLAALALLIARIADHDGPYGAESLFAAVAAGVLWVVFAFAYFGDRLAARLGASSPAAEPGGEVPEQPAPTEAAAPESFPHPVPRHRQFEVITATARVPRPRIVEPVWDCDRPTTQITKDGKLVALGVDGAISESPLPDGVAKQIFELGRRVGQRDKSA